MIANNKQIARMIRIKATSISGLAGIKGFGESKTSHYGDEILEILKRHLKSDYNNKDERLEYEKETQE